MSRREPDTDLARREFLRTAGRVTAAGALVALAAWLLGRSRAGAAGQAAGRTSCPAQGACGSCAAFKTCRLTRATGARQAAERARP